MFFEAGREDTTNSSPIYTEVVAEGELLARHKACEQQFPIHLALLVAGPRSLQEDETLAVCFAGEPSTASGPAH